MSKLVGILNITPDSFSDGGQHDTAEAAYQHAQTLIHDGADILDIGAESTRPHATPLSPMQEWDRLRDCLPDIITLAHQHNKQVSLDTRHADTAEQALTAGVDWINDVSAAQNERLLDIVATTNCHYVFMHALTIPADKNVTLPQDTDITPYLSDYFARECDRLISKGIAQEHIILDPGLGFGKTAVQSLTLLWDAPALRSLGYPLFIGHSRKSCFALMGSAEQRDTLTLLASHYLMQHCIDYLRVHDVRSHDTLRQTMRA